MNENMRKRNEVLAQTVIKGLESRNISGYYAKDKEEALKQANITFKDIDNIACTYGPGLVGALLVLLLWVAVRVQVRLDLFRL